MQFLYRLGFYLGGFSIGLVFLFFILNGKRTKCHYGPQARVLHDLSLKKWNALDSEKQLDSLQLAFFLSNATIDFQKSNTKLDSCKQYHLEGFYNTEKWIIRVENCKNKVRILQSK